MHFNDTKNEYLMENYEKRGKKFQLKKRVNCENCEKFPILIGYDSIYLFNYLVVMIPKNVCGRLWTVFNGTC